MIFGDGYADNSSTSLREMAGVICGGLFVLLLFLGIGGLYLVACVFIAKYVFGDPMFFSLVFFAIGVPLLVCVRWKTR